MKKINMKRKKPQISLEIASVSWTRLKGLKKRVEAATELTLASLPENLLAAASKAEIVLLLTTDKAVQKLNRNFRGLDKPTNVLSFPSFSRRELSREAKGEGEVHVGDLAMAYGTIQKEAKCEDKLLLDHVTHLVIHGILHLFGFDHNTSSKAARMEKLERELMVSLGLLDPYALLPSSKPPSRKSK